MQEDVVTAGSGTDRYEGVSRKGQVGNRIVGHSAPSSYQSLASAYSMKNLSSPDKDTKSLFIAHVHQ